MAYIYKINVNNTEYSIGDASKSTVTLNGTTYANSTATFYAPTSSGDDGYVLTSQSGVPTWAPSGWLACNDPFFYQYDGHSGYLLGANFDSQPVNGSANLLNSAAIYNTLTGYTTSGKNYKVTLDSNGYAYVNVPWTDTKTYLRTSSAYSKYISTSYGSSPTKITTLSGGTYGAVYSISCAGTGSYSRIYVNTSDSTAWSTSQITVVYAGYTTTALPTMALNICVVVPATVTWYLIGQYVTGITLSGSYISG